MSKRTVFTTVTPLPPGISRETVLETLHDHLEMIDLNPLVIERHPIKAPSTATAEEYHCVWYSLTDKVSYLPGGVVTGKVTYNACFHDLAQGLQTHVYAPMGLNIKGKWTLGGSLPGEPVAPVELGVGAPLAGLWLREDVDMKCNIMMTSFVKKTLKKAHSALVSRVLVRAQIVEASMENERISSGAPSMREATLHRQSTAFSQSGSDLGGLRSPEPQGYQLNDSSSFGDEKSATTDPSLYPRPLSTARSMSPAASQSGSQHAGRASYQSSLAGGQNAGPRVSWNQLGSQRSPALHQDQGYQNANPNAYRNSSIPEQNQYQNAPPAYQNPYTPPPLEQHPAYNQSNNQSNYGQAEHYQHPASQHPSQPHPGQLACQSTQPYPEDDHVLNLGPQELPTQHSHAPPTHPVELE
jgi:hypothetical protein